MKLQLCNNPQYESTLANALKDTLKAEIRGGNSLTDFCVDNFLSATQTEAKVTKVYCLSNEFLVALSSLDSNKCERILKGRINAKSTGEVTHTPSLAEKPNFCNSRVNQYGETEVVKLQKESKPVRDEEVREWIYGYTSGKSIPKMAEESGRRKETISRALKRAGVNVTKERTVRRLTQDNIDDIIERYRNFETATEIGERYGVCKQTIIKVLKTNNIGIRSRADYTKEAVGRTI